MGKPIFGPTAILLPKPGTDISRWATLACDQFTSQPEYWDKADRFVGTAPSTLRMVLPEVYLEGSDVAQRVQEIHRTMQQYEKELLTQIINGFVYVERKLQDGNLRQGIIGTIDLEEYSYEEGTEPRIRPSENTVVDRIPPRLAVRKGAVLESPHILMLADDAEMSIIEPIGNKKEKLTQLYNETLMLDGGSIQGWAVTEAQDIENICKAIEALDNKEKFKNKYNTNDEQSAFVFAVGDGNHSLATAKAYWEEIKNALNAAEKENHPARYCLVELENIQSPAIIIEPIHRVVFETDPACLLRSAASYINSLGAKFVIGKEEGQQFVMLYEGKQMDITVKNSPWPIVAGTVDALLDFYAENHAEMKVDYVHGEDSVQELVDKGAIGLLLPPFEKSDLFRGVAVGGVLPKKTFSMGHANDKRYYLECRKIVE